MLTGILLGLLAAFLQSLSYLISASFVRAHATRRDAATALVARSHIAMGILSAIALAITYHLHGDRIPTLTSWLHLGALCIACNMVAQFAMYFTLRFADASRVSPLTGIKILFIALMGITFTGDHYTPLQWGAVALTLCAAYLLSRNGGRLSAAGIAGILITSLAHGSSDFFVRLQQAVFHTTPDAALPTILINLIIVFADYSIGGVTSLALLPFTGRYPARAWFRHILPYSLVWLGAMCVLFIAFDRLGLVHGTIVQSTRGLISIALGFLLARLGFSSLEKRLPPKTQLLRLAAGLLMFLAIVLFALG